MTLVLLDDPKPKVRRLTLNRPERRNALSNDLRRELFEHMRTADLDPDVSVIVIRGAGPSFSSGYDLNPDSHHQPLPRHVAPGDGSWPRHLVEGWFEMWDYATPVIGQVHGHCVAGGTELAAACDLLYVADDAQIGYPPVRTMSSPDMAWQPWFLGMRRAMEALLTGDAMSGIEAVAAGFANRAFPPEDLEGEVLDMAERVALVPPDLQALNKRTVHRSMEAMGIRTGLRATTELQALSSHQQSSREFAAGFAGGITKTLTARDSKFGDYRTTADDHG